MGSTWLPIVSSPAPATARRTMARWVMPRVAMLRNRNWRVSLCRAWISSGNESMPARCWSSVAATRARNDCSLISTVCSFWWVSWGWQAAEGYPVTTTVAVIEGWMPQK